ncbi:PREDICTED: transposase, partial [Prunus dulcis]
VDMRWHFKDRVKDGVLRHPADSEAWKSFNQIHESFGMEPRNVRLGLATDGFNPFGKMNLHYSIWPVLIYPYNLPPWMCMKEPYVFMTLLIPGPKGPCHDIDVYMRPLIDELRTLWEIGVETYDIYVKQNFQMRAALLWTINDYPAYAYMSGWSTSGKLACPYCASNTLHRRLSHGSKTCYLGHRRFLPSDHVWRNQGSQFDNTRERRLAPKRPSGDDVINELSELREITHGKDGKKHTIFGFGKDHNWKKHSIFFQLPYWKTLLVRHNLDVMHIEKNVFENVIGTMMSIDGKTKDSLNARLDLQEMGIRQRYHPEEGDNDGYSGNLSRCVNASERNISGMKTHDCHELCAKVLRQDDLNLLDNQIVLTLCKLEKIFPPAFFDIMIHLTCHLAWEAKVAGPVQFRWMYPVERYLHKLKTYVRNKAHPEGSIAEGVLGDECLIFCSRYLHRVETKFNKRDRNDDGGQPSYDTSPLSIFSTPGRAFGKGVLREMSIELHKAATHYVLQNCDEALPFVQEHKNILIQSSVDNVEESHRLQFSNWISKRVTELYNDGKVSKQMLSLARGPERRVTYYPGYYISGFRFHTLQRDENKKTQNSGIMVKGENQVDDVPWYGTLVDI